MRKSAMFFFFATLVCVLSFTGNGFAQATTRADVPQVLLLGMEAYKPGKPEQGIKVWTKNSPLDGSQAAIDEAANLSQAQSLYGAFQWFDVVSSRDISPRVRVFYVTMNYEAGPLFARFVFYHTDRGWIVTSFDFNLDDTKIFPQPVD